MSDILNQIYTEVSRRRTFAIISHPDAGKTTLTEKLLLYGGAIHLAGSVKQRRGERQTSSDWMEIERQRGISISTSVLQFTYQGCHINLLDTPGHNDFSEDTYRTLAAADAAVMLIDCVKGVEPQTIKLFQVCRLRQIPIITFINKMDRNGRDPLELLDDEEAFSGDIIGLWDPGVLRIGDTVCEGPVLEFPGIPRFSPEQFVCVRLADPLKRKQLQKGLAQLSEEGTVQLFFDRQRLERDPILGAVGILQFEIVRHRLKAEYGVVAEFEPLSYQHARWIAGDIPHLDDFERAGRSTCVWDTDRRPLVLFANDWALKSAQEAYPRLRFLAAIQPPQTVRLAA